jgi:hypothetical protein
MVQPSRLIPLVMGLAVITCGHASENALLSFSSPSSLKHSLEQEVITKSKTVTCQDGQVFYFPENLEGAQEIDVVNAKADGPVVYIEDKEGQLRSFAANKEGVLSRTQIFRLPYLGELYSTFCSPNNLFTLAKNSQGIPAKWALSYTVYPDSYTISIFEMTSCYPIQLRNRDPWLPPYYNYYHPGPSDFVGVDITASGEHVAISGYTLQRQKGFAHRRTNFDLSGNNPLMNYTLPNAGKWQPSPLLQRQQKKIGISTIPLAIPTEDWCFVPLKNNHAPNIMAIEQGRYILVPKTEGGHDVYDCYAKSWSDQLFDTYSLTPEPWASFPEKLPFVPKQRKAIVQGKPGHIRLSTQEPLYGVFQEDSVEKTPEIPLYRASRTFEEVILLNQHQFIDHLGQEIQVQLGDFF